MSIKEFFEKIFGGGSVLHRLFTAKNGVRNLLFLIIFLITFLIICWLIWDQYMLYKAGIGIFCDMFVCVNPYLEN